MPPRKKQAPAVRGAAPLSFAERKAAFKASIRTGSFKGYGRVKVMPTLDSILAEAAYQPPSFGYWFAEFWQEFKTGVGSRGSIRSAGYKKGFEDQMIRFVRFAMKDGLFTKNATEVTSDDLLVFLDTMKPKPCTWRKYHAHLRQVFRWFVKNRHCPVKFSPVEEIPATLVRYKAKPTPLLEASVLPILTHAIADYPRRGVTQSQAKAGVALEMAILTFMLETGSRRGGVCTLRLSRIDWSKKTLTYDDKGKLDIDAALTPALEKALKAYLVVRYTNGEDDDLLFRRPRPDDGRSMAGHVIDALFDKWERWTGIHLTPHMMRKLFAHHVYAKTKDIELTRNLMGHATIEMTRQYLGLAKESKINAMHQLSMMAA